MTDDIVKIPRRWFAPLYNLEDHCISNSVHYNKVKYFLCRRTFIHNSKAIRNGWLQPDFYTFIRFPEMLFQSKLNRWAAHILRSNKTKVLHLNDYYLSPKISNIMNGILREWNRVHSLSITVNKITPSNLNELTKFLTPKKLSLNPIRIIRLKFGEFAKKDTQTYVQSSECLGQILDGLFTLQNIEIFDLEVHADFFTSEIKQVIHDKISNNLKKATKLKSITLRKLGPSTKDVSTLDSVIVNELVSRENIRSLQLKIDPINVEDKLLQLLKNNSKLSTLQLITKLSPGKSDDLLNNLSQLKHIRSLELEFVANSPWREVVNITDAFQNMEKLVDLSIILHQDQSIFPIKKLIYGVEAAKTLKKFRLISTFVSYDCPAFEILGSSLSKISELEALEIDISSYLVTCGSPNKEVANFFEKICQATKLTSLRISFKQNDMIIDSTFTSLKKAIQCLTKLKCLAVFIKSKKITDKGVNVLCEGIEESNSLQTLDLSIGGTTLSECYYNLLSIAIKKRIANLKLDIGVSINQLGKEGAALISILDNNVFAREWKIYTPKEIKLKKMGSFSNNVDYSSNQNSFIYNLNSGQDTINN